MKITVIGTGNAGTTIAADLARKGHEITVLKTSDKLHNDNFAEISRTHRIRVHDLDGDYEVGITAATTDIEAAMRDAELVIVFIQDRKSVV